jgi:hypothetical protein
VTTFAQLAKTVIAPPTTINVPQSVWAHTWEERPKTDLTAGMRLISDAEVQTGQHLARKFATELHPGDTMRERELWVMAYEDALIRHVAARALCDAHNVDEPFRPIAPAPEDIMASKDFVQPDGVRYLFDAYERMRISLDPTQAPLEDDQILELFDAFEDRIALLTPIKAGRVRRLLSYCLSELTE